jgi:lipopolysaccharide/colanic/teichoic acid biosynthesis glycosyltransferase
MSLIGPRPERPEIAEKLHQDVPGYNLRSAVKPGISGYAQIHLPPDVNVNSVRRKIQYDRVYIRRMSVLLDIQICLLTGLKAIGLK